MVDGHRGVSGRNVMLRSVVSTAENCGHERVQTLTRDTGETIARVVSSTQKSVQYVQVRNSIHFELAYTGSCGVLTYCKSEGMIQPHGDMGLNLGGSLPGQSEIREEFYYYSHSLILQETHQRLANL